MPDSNIAMMDLTRTDEWHRMGQAIRWLSDRAEDQPSLTDAAAAVGLSSSHFQRVFSRWVGDRKSTRLNSSHLHPSRMPSSA